MEPGNPPWSPCEACEEKRDVRNMELEEKRTKLIEEGKEDDLPWTIDYCESCDFQCTDCTFCRFDCLQPFFTTYADAELLTVANSNPRAVCFKQYRYATHITHGFMGKGKRVKQAGCIEEGLHQMFPNPPGVDRVGFRKKAKITK